MLISIITVAYNSKSDIEATITSVIPFLDLSVEYIVVDGGSTDGTIDVIRKYNHKLSGWISEADSGIYDAMNKGIKRAKGDFLYFINCGDRLLTLPVEIIEKEVQADAVCFPIIYGEHVRKPFINWRIRLANTLPHQGIFYRNTSGFKYESKYKIFGDYALNLELYLKKAVVKVFNEPVVASHSLDGVSHQKNNAKEIFTIVDDKLGTINRILSFMYFKCRGLYYRLM